MSHESSISYPSLSNYRNLPKAKSSTDHNEVNQSLFCYTHVFPPQINPSQDTLQDRDQHPGSDSVPNY